jgi:flavodoxin/NAD-dependent dihydropyrimidine dehydrogenase PreA subunit
MILYFTGTGNSRFIAKKIASATGDQLISINEKIKKNDLTEIKEGEILIFVVPTYAWRIPKIVEEWILKVDFHGASKAYFVMNCGDSIGNAGKYNSRICRQKGFEYMGTSEIVMPENYIALYKAPDNETSKKIIHKAIPKIENIAKNMKQGEKLPEKELHLSDRFNSSFINTVFYPFIVKADKFIVNDKCIGCGKCEKECPLNNINIRENKPVWDKNCTHCMACICKCPVEAIEYGKNSIGKVRYQCPM